MSSWSIFFREKCIDIFTTTKTVLDIGEGLRARQGAGNIFNPDNAWIQEYINKVTYKVMDPVPDYNPDIVGDIHNLPFENDSREAILCLAVLEHVENPIRAVDELHRTLKPGGKLLIYVPFLFYYHAHEGYYGDYWRFTYDTMKMFSKNFSHHEIKEVRLPVETLVRLTPLGRHAFPIWVAGKLDAVLYKNGSRQVAGYYLYLVK